MRPKKKKITTVRYEDAPEPETVPVMHPIEDDAQEETIQGVINNFAPGQVLVKVYRLTPTGKSFCFNAGPDINEEMIQARGYHGKFSLQVIANGEFRTAIPIEVDPPPAQQQALNGGSNDVTRILLDRLNMLESRLSNPSGEREPINNIADAMMKMHQMMGGARTQSEMTMDQILKCIEIGKSLNSSGEGKDWTSELFGIAKEAIPAVLASVQQQKRIDGGMAVNPAQVAALPEQTMNTEDQMKMKLREALAWLKPMAISPEADPGLWVDVLVARRGSPDVAYLIHKAISEEFSQFIQVDPEIGKPEYIKFFKSIHDGLRSIFSAANTMDVDTGGGGGNKGHASGNGATGKAGSKR